MYEFPKHSLLKSFYVNFIHYTYTSIYITIQCLNITLNWNIFNIYYENFFKAIQSWVLVVVIKICYIKLAPEWVFISAMVWSFEWSRKIGGWAFLTPQYYSVLPIKINHKSNCNLIINFSLAQWYRA